MEAPRIVTPSSDRVRAPCPHYRSCGGCSLMHAADPFVATWKAQVIETALAAHDPATDIRPTPDLAPPVAAAGDAGRAAHEKGRAGGVSRAAVRRDRAADRMPCAGARAGRTDPHAGRDHADRRFTLGHAVLCADPDRHRRGLRSDGRQAAGRTSAGSAAAVSGQDRPADLGRRACLCRPCSDPPVRSGHDRPAPRGFPSGHARGRSRPARRRDRGAGGFDPHRRPFRRLRHLRPALGNPHPGARRRRRRDPDRRPDAGRPARARPQIP